MQGLDARRWAVVSLVLIVAVFGLFAARPDMDVRVAGLFFRDGGFPAERIGWIEAFRDVLWNVAIAGFVLSLAAFLWGLRRRADVLGVPVRVWAFLVALYVASPGILVNGILKSHWGRARPYQIDVFGGSAQFTPPWQITDQCARNCSFVSGEVAGATVLAILLMVTVWFWRNRLGRVWVGMVWGGAALLPVLSSVQRMAAGRHFLSDCLLAILFTSLLAALLYLVLVDRGRRQGS